MFSIPLEGSYNARGIGSASVPWLARSASLDGATSRDEEQLRALGIDAVLDLREPEERGARAHGLPVIAVPLYGAAPPLTGSLEAAYTGLIRDRAAALAEAVGRIAGHPGTLVVHCTAGKDRTGLVVALARTVAGDDPESVLADYALSGDTVRPARRGIVAAQLEALALNDADRASAARLHLDSPAEALRTALALVEDLGGARAYLSRNGVSEELLDGLGARTPGRRRS